jgi:uncharacterized repeat protein (TIGR03803 family)
MRGTKTSIQLFATGAVLILALFALSAGAFAQQERVLFSFNAYQGIHALYGGVIFDKAGNIYGTTSNGGTHSLGAVFELMPNGSGGWTQTVLHNFSDDGIDGFSPQTALVLDSAGNLYGVTPLGGTYDGGTVFELSPAGRGQWSETVLHNFNFNSSSDGHQPTASLSFDSMGNLYGTTSGGGSGTNCGFAGCGTVFELSPQSGGGWSFNTLHFFNNDGADGYHPLYGALVFDAKGNLYGTAGTGGTDNDGIVFELSPQGGGLWKETIVHNFLVNVIDGLYPDGGVIFDVKGNLYGTTDQGGNSFPGYGTVYELSPAADGSWTESILFNCASVVGGTIYPRASVVFDSRGDLYGTSVQGGDGWGNVFALRPTAHGWVERTVHSFQNNRKDGTGPYDALIVGPSGNLYGTTAGGGLKQGGTVFEIIP